LTLVNLAKLIDDIGIYDKLSALL